MPEYTLRIRRYSPETGDSAYWEDFSIELGYMLDCAECIVTGALERKESRGAQFRLDYPKRNDDEWLKHITLSVNGGGPPEVSYTPVTLTKWEPQERTY